MNTRELSDLPAPFHDAESATLKDSPEFLAILQRSQASYDRDGGYSLDEVRGLLGVPSKRRKRPVSAGARRGGGKR